MPKRVSTDGQVIVDHDRLARTLKVLRTQGKTITLLCGDFDVLGAGAVRAVLDAAVRSHHLVIGLMSDRSLEERDGALPLLSEAERCEVVAAISGVDYVTVVEMDEVDGLVRNMRPTLAARCVNEKKRSGQIEEEWAVDAGARVVGVGDAKCATNRALRKSIAKRLGVSVTKASGAKATNVKAGAKVKASSAVKASGSGKNTKAATPKKKAAAKKKSNAAAGRAKKSSSRKAGARKSSRSPAGSGSKKKVRATV